MALKVRGPKSTWEKIENGKWKEVMGPRYRVKKVTGPNSRRKIKTERRVPLVVGVKYKSKKEKRKTSTQAKEIK